MDSPRADATRVQSPDCNRHGVGTRAAAAGEVQSVRREPEGGCTITVRFTALDEKLRARLQREVLRFEREAIRAKGDLVDEVLDHTAA